MILMGQSPETIFDVCKRAMDFYHFQKAQELKYYEYINYKLAEKGRSLEVHCKTMISGLEERNHKLQNEKDALIKECEELRDSLVVSSQKLTQLEGELQKLSLSRISDDDRTKSCLEATRARMNMGPITEPRSDETVRSKFPRCSPDSSYASPASFRGCNSFLPFSFKKQFEKGSSVMHSRSELRPSPECLRSQNRTAMESYRNLSRASSKTFF
ncbi:unnamed protein product [Calicophoron daubneyi]